MNDPFWQNMADKMALKELGLLYARAVDRRDFALMRRLYTEDGTDDTPKTEPTITVFSSRERLRSSPRQRRAICKNLRLRRIISSTLYMRLMGMRPMGSCISSLTTAAFRLLRPN